MPRSWLQGDGISEHLGSTLPPKPADMFRLVYGEDWCARMSAVFGRQHRTVLRWGTGENRIPNDVMIAMRNNLSNPRWSGDLYRGLKRSAEREYEIRLAAGKWAERWLRLILAGEASFPPLVTRKRKKRAASSPPPKARRSRKRD